MPISQSQCGIVLDIITSTDLIFQLKIFRTVTHWTTCSRW